MVGTSLGFLMLTAMMVVIITMIGGMEDRAILLVVFGIVPLALIPTLLLRTRSLALSGALLVIQLHSGLFVQLFVESSFETILLTWLTLPPLVAGFVIGRKALLLTATVDIAIIVTLWFVTQHLQIEVAGSEEPILGFISSAFLVAFVSAVAVLFERGRGEAAVRTKSALEELRANNRELQRARDLAEESNRAKTDFLARMSHEVRTPMSGVLGMNELLLQSELQEEQQEYARLIRKSAKSLLSVLDDILDFSKLDAGELRLEINDFDPRTPTEQAISLLAGAAHRRGLELLSFVRPEVPRQILGASDRVHQVLVNLISNAIKYTEMGRVSVDISLEDFGPGRQEIRFEVTDSGSGFSSEESSRLFEPFYQIDSSTTRRHPGTGLGLAICQELVGKMEGRIGVESKEGMGSTFWFSIPARKSTRRRQEDHPWSRKLSGRKFLWVGAGAHDAACARAYLENWNAKVTFIASLSDLPDGHHIEDFDATLLDSLDGADSLVGDLRDLPVILVVPPGTSVEGNTGQNTVRLRKPLQESPLLSAVCRALDVETPPWMLSDERTELDFLALDSKSRAGTRVLVVEDNAVNLRLSVEVLRRHGYEVETAISGAAALNMLVKNSYDVILMDCQMPELDGYDTTGAIRASEDDGCRTPIVAVTAHAMDGERDRCIAVGMDDFLSKPYFPQQLLEVVARWT